MLLCNIMHHKINDKFTLCSAGMTFNVGKWNDSDTAHENCINIIYTHTLGKTFQHNVPYFHPTRWFCSVWQCGPAWSLGRHQEIQRSGRGTLWFLGLVFKNKGRSVSTWDLVCRLNALGYAVWPSYCSLDVHWKQVIPQARNVCKSQIKGTKEQATWCSQHWFNYLAFDVCFRRKGVYKTNGMKSC